MLLSVILVRHLELHGVWLLAASEGKLSVQVLLQGWGSLDDVLDGGIDASSLGLAGSRNDGLLWVLSEESLAVLATGDSLISLAGKESIIDLGDIDLRGEEERDERKGSVWRRGRRRSIR